MSRNSSTQLARWIQSACLWEATAPKAGNVHPGASFADLTYADFVRSAEITAQQFQAATNEQGTAHVSETILKIAQAIRQQVGKNTNLGILLLMIPLAAVPQNLSLSAGIGEVIDRLNVADTVRFYQAIHVMQPGGMHEVSQEDLSQTPTLPVRQVMQLAEHYDLIARQYTRDFSDVLGFGLNRLEHWWQRTQQQPSIAIVGLHLEWMAQFPDSLIARKCGFELAQEVAERAGELLQAGWPESPQSAADFVRLDAWLRADGNRRNPGTSADLVAATLFAGLREGLIEL